MFYAKSMKSKLLLFIGIILLTLGVLLKKAFHLDTLGITLIITGVIFKSIYIIQKIKSGEYKPGKELIFLVTGLLLLFIGLYLQGINQTLIMPIFLIVSGLILKTIFIIRFIQIVKQGKK